ncbi:hypothetical protein DICPUDRAFT_153988 [Dictyostelium purpureum]|uniref:FNIP repeat-containing protein n=2 Tax=Dictyostelium purpureum TaxID=5786 RepID=F0ZQ96_DICPU|nr:uncharacterized protein DICPUDRAFT_153988 [Dictyostelium purpureum]EGC33866.1 hypothetical protein DICPUDRAFT_153988 [Dictyostelium purpureum]|eukprot:XP_003289604.1 hypothetical protein DICPUDRAFT_153988 [Dictyostelium purpureum]
MSIINEKIIFYNNCMADIESKENCLILKEEDIINGHLKTYKKEEENKVNQIVFYSSFNMTNDKATLIGLYEKYEYFHQNILQTFNDLKVLITCHFYNNNYSFLSTLKHLSIFKYENFNIFSNRFKIKINNDCKDHDMEKLKLFKEAINKKNNLKIEEYSVEDIHLKFSEVPPSIKMLENSYKVKKVIYTFKKNSSKPIASIIKYIIPLSAKKLKFGNQFNQPLSAGVIPSSVETLTFGNQFNQPLSAGVIPSSVKTLTFGFKFNQPLSAGVIPSSVETLIFGFKFNQPISAGVIPSSVKTLIFGDWFNQPLSPSAIPPSVEILEVGGSCI